MRSPELPGGFPTHDRLAATAGRPSTSRHGTASPAAGTATQFETMMLRSLVESVMPKSGGAYYGSKAGGNVWRSFLTQELAQVLENGGGLGLAAPIAAQLKADARARPADESPALARSSTPEDQR